MITLNKSTQSLRSDAENKGIYIEDRHLDKVGSLTVRLYDEIYIIGIDTKEMTKAQERVHLAHEMGHCETGAVYDARVPLKTRGRCEHEANVWAIKELLPKEELRKAFKRGIVEVWELAEEFEVTEDFIRLACKYYFNRG